MVLLVSFVWCVGLLVYCCQFVSALLVWVFVRAVGGCLWFGLMVWVVCLVV